MFQMFLGVPGPIGIFHLGLPPQSAHKSCSISTRVFEARGRWNASQNQVFKSSPSYPPLISAALRKAIFQLERHRNFANLVEKSTDRPSRSNKIPWAPGA